MCFVFRFPPKSPFWPYFWQLRSQLQFKVVFDSKLRKLWYFWAFRCMKSLGLCEAHHGVNRSESFSHGTTGVTLLNLQELQKISEKGCRLKKLRRIRIWHQISMKMLPNWDGFFRETFIIGNQWNLQEYRWFVPKSSNFQDEKRRFAEILFFNTKHMALDGIEVWQECCGIKNFSAHFQTKNIWSALESIYVINNISRWRMVIIMMAKM